MATEARALPSHAEWGAQDAVELQVSSILLRVLANVMLKRGIAPAAYMASAATSLYDEPDERMLPFSELERALLSAAKVARDPALGLACGLLASDSSFGMMAPLVAHAATLREGLEHVSQFHSLLADRARFRIVDRTGFVELQCELLSPRLSRSHSLVELMMAGLVRLLREFGCMREDILSVSFQYARPAHHAAYTRAFAGAERFGRPYTGFELAPRALDRPHLHRNGELHRLMLEQAERCLEQRARPERYAEQVSALLRGARPGELPQMESVSRQLGISVRSLRRRLDEEGTSYRDLTQALLHEAACSMLRNPKLTFKAIADALGFADSTVFHRSFRRWAGHTPSEYRATLPNTATRRLTRRTA